MYMGLLTLLQSENLSSQTRFEKIIAIFVSIQFNLTG